MARQRYNNRLSRGSRSKHPRYLCGPSHRPRLFRGRNGYLRRELVHPKVFLRVLRFIRNCSAKNRTTTPYGRGRTIWAATGSTYFLPHTSQPMFLSCLTMAEVWLARDALHSSHPGHGGPNMDTGHTITYGGPPPSGLYWLEVASLSLPYREFDHRPRQHQPS